MQDRFIVSHDGQDMGPFSREEIVTKVKSGELSVIDFVYVDDQGDWITLLEFAPDVNSQPKSEPVAAKAVVPEPPAPVVAPPPAVAKSEAKPEVKIETKVEAKVEPKAVPKIEPKPEIKIEPKPEPKAEIKIDAPKSEPKSEVKAGAKSDNVEIKGGVGSIDLVQFAAGQARLRVRTSAGDVLEVPQPLPIQVKAAPASKIAISGPSESVAGQTCVFHLEALDKFGNRDQAFTGGITVSLSGSAQGGGLVRFKGGKAEVSVTNKIAERVHLKLVDSEKLGLDLSAHAEVLYNADKAARIVVVAPEEAVAGQPLKVTLKAVDAYGNLATAFGGEVKVEVDPADEPKRQTG